MQVFTTVHQLRKFLDKHRKRERTIGFVPTLGALHAGHLSLMHHAGQIADLVVASIFVNPTQFNDPKDLEKYPRPLAQDIHVLSTNKVDVLFLPPAEEVYPKELHVDVPIDISHLTYVLEGPNRPGHFEGVVTVVKRLLDIVTPNYLIMGQKDYQQQAIIGSMIDQLKLPCKLIIHPTERDQDGLALSSRNSRIDPGLRPIANTLYLALKQARSLTMTKSPADVAKISTEKIIKAGFKLEYFSIVDGITLQPIGEWKDSETVVACVAAWLGDVRLIDNLRLK